MLQFCCKFTSVSICQKLWKYNAVWKSHCKNKRVPSVCPTVYIFVNSSTWRYVHDVCSYFVPYCVWCMRCCCIWHYTYIWKRISENIIVWPTISSCIIAYLPKNPTNLDVPVQFEKKDSLSNVHTLQTTVWITMYLTNLMCMSRPFISFDRIGRTSSDNVLLLSC